MKRRKPPEESPPTSKSSHSHASSPVSENKKKHTHVGHVGDEPGHDHNHGHSHGHDHEDHREQARELLRARGLRITAPRLAVLTALLDNHRPTTAQELIGTPETQGMDQVTVYRTLNTLVDEGIAQAVGTTDRGRRFEVHACEGCRIDHPHLQCRRCSSLECLEQGMLPAMLVPTEVAGFLIDEARLYLYGLCPACRKAGST